MLLFILLLMKQYQFFIMLLLVAVAAGQNRPMRLAEIEFFGGTGLDLTRIRAAIPLRENNEFSSEEAVPAAISQIKQAVERVAGRPPSDVEMVCCDEQGRWTFYVGLAGHFTRNIAYNPSPKGSVRLPAYVVNLYEQSMDALDEAVRQGKSREDDSGGFAISEYPPLRAKQLAIREYALQHVRLISQVLKSSQDARQRRVAAQVLGYARQSKEQIAALVHASRDEDETVRNNAVRALGVLTRSDTKVAARIPAAGFVEMLNSGEWTDRNKAGILLELLSQRRDRQLLMRLRSQALESLLEMARWRSRGHAHSALVLLGRMAGIEESRLQQLVLNGEGEQIIKALDGK
jgi:HEAT repeats